MQVLGNITKFTFRLVSVLLALCCSAQVFADGGRILLRQGPGDAFPVVSEIPSDHSMQVKRLRSGWVLLADDRKQGWADAEHLAPSRSISESQLWYITEQTTASVWSLSGGVSSQRAFNLALSRPWKDYSLALEFQRAASGRNGWQDLSLFAGTRLGRVSASSAFHGALGLGIGVNEEGNDHWSNKEEELTTAVASVAVDWQKKINPDFNFVLRVRSDKAFSGNQKNHNSVALMWKLRL